MQEQEMNSPRSGIFKSSNSVDELMEEIELMETNLESFKPKKPKTTKASIKTEKAYRIKDYRAQIEAFGEIVDWLPRTDR